MRTLHSRMFKSLALAAGTVLAGNASAATLADLGFSPEQIRAITAMANAPATSPGIAFGSPTGFGAGWGIIGFGVSGRTLPSNQQDDVDGSASLSVGLGNPTKWVGLQADLNIISLRQSFGEDGSFNLKLHTVLPGRMSVAVGVDNIGGWGAAENTEESVYGVATKVFSLNPSNPSNQVPLVVNVGVGDNRFESNGNEGVGLFGGLALLPHPQLSLILDWDGQKLNSGVSFVPLRTIPMTITLGAENVSGRTVPGLGDSTEFSGSLGYTFRF